MFKEGDVVEYVGQLARGEFTPGKKYIVGGKYHNPRLGPGRTGVVSDDGNRPNGWSTRFFRPAYQGAQREVYLALRGVRNV